MSSGALPRPIYLYHAKCQRKMAAANKQRLSRSKKHSRVWSLEPSLSKIHASGVHLLADGHLKLQLPPAVPLTRPPASLPYLLIKWSVCNSLRAEHTGSLCLKMTGRRNRSRITNPLSIPKLIRKLHKEWFLNKTVDWIAKGPSDLFCRGDV